MPIKFETIYDTMTLIRAGKKEELPFEILDGPVDRQDRTRSLTSPISPLKAPTPKKLSSDRKVYSAHSALKISKPPPLDFLRN